MVAGASSGSRFIDLLLSGSSRDAVGFEDNAPGGELALEAPARIRRAGRRQAMHRQAEQASVTHRARRLASVVRDALELRRAHPKAGQVIELRILDRTVETAQALATRVDIPDAQAVRAQGGQPRV